MLGLLLLLPLIYLVPLPQSLSDWLPGHEPYLTAGRLAQPTDDLFTTTASVSPLHTQVAWLTLLIPIAVYLVARTLSERQMLLLLALVLGMAAFQATLGMVQYGAGQGGLLLYGFDPAKGAAGTYTNRNHLAGLLEMLLPVALALLLYSMGRRVKDQRDGWRRRASFLASVRGHQAIVYGALALLLILGIIFTRSRAGIALAMFGIMLSTLLFSRRIGGDNVYGLTGTLIVLALGLGMTIGLAPVLDRFSVDQMAVDARMPIYAATIEGIGAFLPFGSGPGTFPSVFPAFQPLELGAWFINRAHNDYLEWVFDGGIPAAMIILSMFGLYAFQWTRLYTRERWSRFRFVQIGAGVGLFMLLLHELVDYNLHTPANMVIFALLAGIFFSDPSLAPTQAARHRRPRRTPDLAAAAPRHPPGNTPVPDQIPNPFLDPIEDGINP